MPTLASDNAQIPGKAGAESLPLNSQFKSLLHQIYSIETVGTWSHSGQKGSYRVIALRKNAKQLQTKLFVQWISKQKNGEANRVYATLPVVEVNGPGIYTFEKPEFSIGENRRKILTFFPKNIYTSKARKMVLELSDEPRYQVLGKNIVQGKPAKQLPTTQKSTEDIKVLEVVERIPGNILDYRWPGF